jgi:predicted nucleic acid-binding Zn finger protein
MRAGLVRLHTHKFKPAPMSSSALTQRMFLNWAVYIPLKGGLTLDKQLRIKLLIYSIDLFKFYVYVTSGRTYELILLILEVTMCTVSTYVFYIILKITISFRKQHKSIGLRREKHYFASYIKPNFYTQLG